jgi:hypothetical protein
MRCGALRSAGSGFGIVGRRFVLSGKGAGADTVVAGLTVLEWVDINFDINFQSARFASNTRMPIARLKTARNIGLTSACLMMRSLLPKFVPLGYVDDLSSTETRSVF